MESSRCELRWSDQNRALDVVLVLLPDRIVHKQRRWVVTSQQLSLPLPARVVLRRVVFDAECRMHTGSARRLMHDATMAVDRQHVWHLDPDRSNTCTITFARNCRTLTDLLYPSTLSTTDNTGLARPCMRFISNLRSGRAKTKRSMVDVPGGASEDQVHAKPLGERTSSWSSARQNPNAKCP